jgi:hypothetical protein
VLNGLAPLASPAFTGTPTAPTPANGESSTVLATTQFVKLVLAVGTYTTAIADGIVSYAKMATSAIATTAEYLSNTASKLLTPNVAWAAADWVTLTDGATVTPDFSAGINFNWALGAAGRTLANPTNMKNGQSGCIYLNAGASGTLTIWGSYWKFAGGVKPTLTPNSADVICYTVRTSTLIICTFIPDVR